MCNIRNVLHSWHLFYDAQLVIYQPIVELKPLRTEVV